MKQPFITTIILIIVLAGCKKEDNSLVFSAIGDVPYSEEDYVLLNKSIIESNTNSKSEFLIHLGDIKSGGEPCDEQIYSDVSNILKKSVLPVYIIPGDNEINDCEDPIAAYDLWNKYFFHLNENWPSEAKIKYQPNREENFMWIQKDVLFVGLNQVGGRIIDRNKWDERLKSNALWIDHLVQNQGERIKVMVIFGHANMNLVPENFKSFMSIFSATAESFQKPILYLHGDGHVWVKDKPWKQQNIQRVQVDAGANILKIRINTNKEDPFVFIR